MGRPRGKHYLNWRGSWSSNTGNLLQGSCGGMDSRAFLWKIVQRELGLSDIYNVIYRNFSRNVHGTDYMEHLGGQGMGDTGEWPDSKDLQDHVALSVTITCLCQMALMTNNLFGYELDAELKETWKACASFGHWVRIPHGRLNEYGVLNWALRP